MRDYAEIAMLLAVPAVACVVLVWALALLSHKAARIVGQALYFVYVSALPITALVALMIALYLRGAPSDGIAAVPWLLIFAVPACAITIPLAIFTAMYFGRDRPRRFPPSVIALAVAVVAAAPGGYLRLTERHERLEWANLDEQADVLSFVEANDAVDAALTDYYPWFAMEVIPHRKRDGLVEQYLVTTVHVPANELIVVDVMRNADAAEYRAACVVPSKIFYGQFARGFPCEMNGARALD